MLTSCFHIDTRPAETRRHTDSDASRILNELLEVSETNRAGIEGRPESRPLIEGPSVTASSGGDENAAGIGDDASADMESMAGAAAGEQLIGNNST